MCQYQLPRNEELFLHLRYCCDNVSRRPPPVVVGHVNEFNDDDLFWRQELIVPPETHQVTVTRYGKELWSGPITVPVPTNAESARFYPNQAPDSQILWQKPKPARTTVEASN